MDSVIIISNLTNFKVHFHMIYLKYPTKKFAVDSVGVHLSF